MLEAVPDADQVHGSSHLKKVATPRQVLAQRYQ
jgi:hypothetical protein